MKFLPLITFLFLAPAAVFGDFRIEPGSIGQGKIQEIALVYDAQDAPINAVEGSLEFPPEISILGFSDANSIVSPWIDRPKIENSRIHFSGLIAGGYGGNDGVIFTVRVQAEETGIAAVRLENTRAYRHDGEGTVQPAAVSRFDIRIAAQGEDAAAAEDREPPERFEPELAKDPSAFEGKYFISFDTQDKGSGMSHFEIMEVPQAWWGGRPRLESWKRVESPYVLMDQELQSDVLIRAVDQAGNFVIVELPRRRSEELTFYVISGLILVCLLVIRRVYIKR